MLSSNFFAKKKEKFMGILSWTQLIISWNLSLKFFHWNHWDFVFNFFKEKKKIEGIYGFRKKIENIHWQNLPQWSLHIQHLEKKSPKIEFLEGLNSILRPFERIFKDCQCWTLEILSPQWPNPNHIISLFISPISREIHAKKWYRNSPLIAL